MQALIGTKKSQGQRFLENGMRIPVTLIDVKDNCVIALLTKEKNNYQAVQLGFGIRKHATKAQIGHAKGAKRDGAPKFLKEVRIVSDESLPEVGTILNPTEVFAPGDIVNVSGISKGKGYAGVVKRHGFHGGPKTHGQSDRWRAPGAIGQGTTPGRVYKGKRMAGRMGNENVTVRNLEIIDITDDGVLIIKGLVPGIINNAVYIEKVGEDKKFVPLWKEAVEEVQASDAAEEKVEESTEQVEEVKTESVDEAKAEEMPVENSEETKDETPKKEAKEDVKAADVENSGEPKEVTEDGK